MKIINLFSKELSFDFVFIFIEWVFAFWCKHKLIKMYHDVHKFFNLVIIMCICTKIKKPLVLGLNYKLYNVHSVNLQLEENNLSSLIVIWHYSCKC